jgi:hypothetical protein
MESEQQVIRLGYGDGIPLVRTKLCYPSRLPIEDLISDF